MRHTCPDGQQTRLIREDKPVGDMSATFTCPHCGWSDRADAILARARAILTSSAVRAALR